MEGDKIVARRGFSRKLVRGLRALITNPLGMARLLWEIVGVYVFGMPVAVFIRLLKPLVVVRFGRIDCTRLGHFIGMCEIYSCKRSRGAFRGYRDLLYTTGVPMNRYLWGLYNRQLRFSGWMRFPDIANRRLPGSERHVAPITSVNLEGIYEQTSPSIALDEAERRAGDAWLESVGVDTGRPLVLFANRDPAFLQKIDPDRDWSYHDCRDSSVANMLPMARAMVAKGYAAIRMGSDVVEALDVPEPMIIDYASRARSEALDIYLAARCNLFIATTSGILDLGRLFRKATGVSNTVPLQSVITFYRNANELWIPKLHWSVADKRLMKYSEILALQGDPNMSETYAGAGVELIENTGDEIVDLTLELEELAAGKRSLDAEDKALYRKFWDIVLEGRPWNRETPIALSFLRKHVELLA